MPTGVYKRKPLSEETKRKISQAQKGKPRPLQSVLNMKGKTKSRPSYGMFGKKHTEEAKKRIGIGATGNKYRLGKKHPANCTHCLIVKSKTPWNKGKKGLTVAWNKGKKLSTEHVAKLKGERLHTRGEKSFNWKGGVTPINEMIRKSLEYKLWRKSVFERDRFTCVWCGYKSNKKINGKPDIQADHIKRFSDYPELRFAIDNGRTLCVPCHKTTDTYGTKNWSKNKKTLCKIL